MLCFLLGRPETQNIRETQSGERQDMFFHVMNFLLLPSEHEV